MSITIMCDQFIALLLQIFGCKSLSSLLWTVVDERIFVFYNDNKNNKDTITNNHV